MNPDPESARFLHLVTGTQLKVLLALKLLINRASINDIAAVANCDRGTASAALNALAILGYTESTDRYHWQLSTACVQLPLFTRTQHTEALREGENFPVPCSSSSSSSSSTRVEENKLLPPLPEGENFPIQAANLLRTHTALSSAVIQRTLQNAVAAGLTAKDLPQIIHAWRAYCHARPSIYNPDSFIAARLTEGRQPPEAPPPAKHRDYSADTTIGLAMFNTMTAAERRAYYVPAGYEDLIEH